MHGLLSPFDKMRVSFGVAGGGQAEMGAGVSILPRSPGLFTLNRAALRAPAARILEYA